MATPPDLQETPNPFTPEMAPGFFTEASARGAPTRWKTGDKVRFHDNIAQKLGGWVLQAFTGDAHNGVPRRTHEWSSLDTQRWISYGTQSKLYLLNNGVRYDITPLRRTVTLVNPFTTTIGSAAVTVLDVAHDAVENGFVRFANATVVGGLTITGEYQITAVIDGASYQITASGLASASATGGGTPTAMYDINPGNADPTVATGWGICVWSEDAWGTSRDEGCSNVVTPPRIWSLDNFGEDLIASPRSGAVYHWDRTNGPESRAVLLTEAPLTNERVLISNSGGRIICLGAFDEVANSSDPMLIRVGSEESLTEFDVAEDNTVFEQRLATGSRIITGVRTRGAVFVSTDKAQYVMQEDPVEIFRVTKIGEGNPVIGPNAMLEVDGTVHYMSSHKFMRFDSVLEEMPCDVWDSVYQNPSTRVDLENGDKVYAWYNEAFSEIWWHYPSVGGAGENDRYVVFNRLSRTWYYGTLARTAASPPGPFFSLPFAFDDSGALYLHETGNDAAGEPMLASLESHDIELGDGRKRAYISKVVPDMIRQTGAIDLTLKSKRRPNQTNYVQKGPYEFNTTTLNKGVNITGRQIAVVYSSSDVGDSWRMGRWTFYIQADSEE